MSTISIDNKEYIVPSEVGLELGALRMTINHAADEHERLKGRVAELETELEKQMMRGLQLEALLIANDITLPDPKEEDLPTPPPKRTITEGVRLNYLTRETRNAALKRKR